MDTHPAAVHRTSFSQQAFSRDCVTTIIITWGLLTHSVQYIHWKPLPPHVWMFVACGKISRTDIFQPDEASFFYSGPSREPEICSLVVIPELSPPLVSLFVYSHTELVMRAQAPLFPPPTHPPPHYLLYLMGPLLFPPPLSSPLLFIYLSILPQRCGLPFLISSVKHDYYLLMPKLRGHSFCHPRRCIFPA